MLIAACRDGVLECTSEPRVGPEETRAVPCLGWLQRRHELEAKTLILKASWFGTDLVGAVGRAADGIQREEPQG